MGRRIKTESTPQSPQDFFTTYMIAGLQTSLERINAAPDIVPDIDRQQAWHLLSFALKVLKTWPNTRALLLALTPKMEQAGYWEEWIPYLERGVACSQQVNDCWAEARLQLDIGHLQQRLGNYGQAEHYLTSALDYFHSVDDQDLSTFALCRLANCALHRRQFVVAKALMQNAFALSPLDESTEAYCHFIAGHIYCEQKEFSRARNAYERAMTLWQNAGDQRRFALSQQNLGRVLMLQHAYPQALQYYQAAADILSILGDEANLAVVQMNMGITHSLLGASQHALVHYQKAKRIFQTTGAIADLAHNFTNEGIEYTNLQNWSAAEDAFHQSITLWRQLNNRYYWANAVDGLGLVLFHREQYENAVNTFQEALHLLKPYLEQPEVQRLHADISEHIAQVARAMVAVPFGQPTAKIH